MRGPWMVSVLAWLLAFVSVASPVRGETWTEAGDAGETLETAQRIDLPGGVTRIEGRLEGDVDLYLIEITDPQAFSARVASVVADDILDTQLFLFDASGLGVYANDDGDSPVGFGSYLPPDHPDGPTEAGLYALAFTFYDIDPFSESGAIFPLEPGEVAGPFGEGGVLPLAFWALGNEKGNASPTGTGDYALEITGAEAIVSSISFRRGDTFSNGRLDIGDSVLSLLHLFQGRPITCEDAHDYNDDGELNLSDVVNGLNFLFVGGMPPAAPRECGVDASADELGCELYADCD